MARTRDSGKIDAIYDATLKLVLKTGFNGLKMAEVAKAAGIATGTLYIYFKNKDVLINQLFITLKAAKTYKVLTAYTDNDTFEVTFRKLWFNYLELSLAEPERMMFIEQFAHTSYLTKKTRAQGDELLKPLYDFLERGIERNLIVKLPPPLLLSQLIGPIYEVVKQIHEGTVALTPRMKEKLFEMAWNGIKID